MQYVKIMKGIKAVFFTICLVVFNFSSVLAEVRPPAPMAIPAGGPAGPPGDAPIDSHIVLLVIIAIVFGITIVYRDKIKKASI